MKTLLDRMREARSLLFAPGHRPDRFEKAAASRADGIVLDLEDSVGPGEKPCARKNIERWLSSGGIGAVRINGVGTQWFEEDLAMVAEFPLAVLVPKADPEATREVFGRLAPGSCVLPIVETARGILEARSVCAQPGVVRAIFGNVDLAKELGIDLADLSALSAARSQLVLASAAAGVTAPLDGVTVVLDDDEKLRSDSVHASLLGYRGKICLHPRQIDIVHAAFAPAEAELQWARNVVDAAGNGSITKLDGQMIGKPIVDRARELLARSAISYGQA
ncbi:CoA ester lyase [Dactylosporangium roseum]|uniref:CoA ester lyase n=1 Tax=Dactylosporangium roseum TaxID=47989 RepID=A0ABY5Z027_9ACTN|nr:CoA ester lyase [Dactylosporangium roseum]UWZ34807.1 CoA ester lyase [Dactylosporangium roseum]